MLRDAAPIVRVPVQTCVYCDAGIWYNARREAADWSVYLHSAAPQDPRGLPAQCRGGRGVDAAGLAVSVCVNEW